MKSLFPIERCLGRYLGRQGSERLSWAASLHLTILPSQQPTEMKYNMLVAIYINSTVILFTLRLAIAY